MANMVGQIGCLTSVASFLIIGITGGVGYLADRVLGTQPIFMVIGLIGSFPITLYVIVRISLSMMARAQRVRDQLKLKEKINQEGEKS